jgi:hypothetical protein
MMAAVFAVPALIMILTRIHPTQFFLRYGTCGAVGFALLVPFAMMRARRTQAVGVLMTVAMLLTSVVRANTDTFDAFGTWRAFTIPGVPPQRLEALDPSLPIAMASAPRFVELNDEEPAAVARRLSYVTDSTEAQRYSAQTLFETEDQAIGPLRLLGKVEPREAFFAAHPRFYMIAIYPDPEEWLMRYLMANGASVRYMGKFVSTVSADDLYLVTLPGK